MTIKRYTLADKLLESIGHDVFNLRKYTMSGVEGTTKEIKQMEKEMMKIINKIIRQSKLTKHKLK